MINKTIDLNLVENLKNYCKVNGMTKGESEVLNMIVNFIPIEIIWDKISDLQRVNIKISNVTANSLPTHYSNRLIEPIDFIEENNIGFSLGNIIKYMSRYKEKNGNLDLEKCKFYTDTYYNKNYTKYESYKKYQTEKERE